MHLFPDDTPLSASAIDRKVDKRRQGWTTWQRGSPRGGIYRLWGPTREVHWPKRNVTEHFTAAGELVGEEKWGVHLEWWRTKRLPAGQALYQRTQAEIDETERRAMAWINARRAERGEPLLPLRMPAA